VLRIGQPVGVGMKVHHLVTELSVVAEHLVDDLLKPAAAQVVQQRALRALA
jgi:hypothetical protein